MIVSSDKEKSGRILIVVPSLKLGGGAERIASKLAINLEKAGHSLMLVTFFDEEKENNYNGRRISLGEDKDGVKALKLLSRIINIYKISRNYHPDVLVAFSDEANIPAVCGAKLAGVKKKIISVRRDPCSRNLVFRLLMRASYWMADFVVAVNNQMRSDLEADFGLSNVVTIYNFIDKNDAIEESKKELPQKFSHLFEKGGFIFLNIGRLEKVKGQSHLIEAFSVVKDVDPKSRLLIIGEGSERKNLEDQIKGANLDGRVHLLGRHFNVFPFLRKSNLFIAAPRKEAFANVFLEALACNVPVVSTDCKAGPREALAPEHPFEEKISYPYWSSCGALVDPDNPVSGLSMVMEKFIRDREIRARYSLVDTRVDEFSPDKIISEWSDLLDRA